MTSLFKLTRITGLALALLTAGLAVPIAAQPTGAGGLVAHWVARLYIDLATGDGQCIGYFTSVAGIAGPFFHGTPGEGTAYFTFRSDVFKLTALPSAGDLQPDLLSAGNYAIYLNRQPIGDWSAPDTFSSGQRIAAFKRPESLVSLFPQSFHAAIGEELVSTQPFLFKGHTYDFSAIAPHGLTLFDFGSMNPLTGSGVGVGRFSLVLPYAGSSIAVGPNY